MPVFSHIAVACQDPLAIERFYAKHFGFERARVYLPGPGQVVVIKSGAVSLELFPAKEPRHEAAPVEDGPWTPGWRHIAFLVEDLDATIASIGADARLTLGPFDMGQFIPGMRVAWIADPEGNIVELNQGYTDEINPPSA